MARSSYADDFDRAMAVAEARAVQRRRAVFLGVLGVVLIVALGAWILHHGRKLDPIEQTHQLPRVSVVPGPAVDFVQRTGQRPLTSKAGVLLAPSQV